MDQSKIVKILKEKISSLRKKITYQHGKIYELESNIIDLKDELFDSKLKYKETLCESPHTLENTVKLLSEKKSEEPISPEYERCPDGYSKKCPDGYPEKCSGDYDCWKE